MGVQWGDALLYDSEFEDKPLFITGTTPAGVSVNDTYTYNGLGMRQTGPGLNPLTDGQTPGSPILVNGSVTYTPGISRSGGPNGSLFYLTDGHDEVLGQTDSAWTSDDDIRYNPWGDQIKHGGSAPTGVTQGWGVEAAYQQDGDTDLILMGSRYYDPSIGRFLSQDPAGAGDNWYAYCGNDPVDEEDPDGLLPYPTEASIGGGGGDGAWIGALMGGSGYEGEGGGASFVYLTRWDRDKKAGQYSATWSVPLWEEDDNDYFGGKLERGPQRTTFRQDFKEADGSDMHIYHSQGETNVNRFGGWRQGIHDGKELKPLPKGRARTTGLSFAPSFRRLRDMGGVAGKILADDVDGVSADLGMVFAGIPRPHTAIPMELSTLLTEL